MRVTDAYPSSYLKAADFQGRDVTVVISKVVMEDIGDDHKPVLYFQGKDKGLVLNKTNANNIAQQHGDEMDSWIGRQITMFASQTDFQGKTVPCIRIKLKAAGRAVVSSPGTPRPDDPKSQTDVDDEIPF